jgi:hypothetical protein
MSAARGDFEMELLRTELSNASLTSRHPLPIAGCFGAARSYDSGGPALPVAAAHVPTHEPDLAAHLVTSRFLYTHHGLYIGAGRVIHYAGLAYGWRRGPVEIVPLERFAGGHVIRIQCDRRLFDRCQVVARALSRLGECRYRLLTNNCEHFCAWALRNECCSPQVERLLALPRKLFRSLSAFIHSRSSSCTPS